MKKSILRQQIAYRCPACGIATVGFLGGLAALSDMLRLKCECGEYSLDIKREGDKVRLSVPCVYCKNHHSYVISADIFAREDATRLSCPHSGQDILFIANEDDMQKELERSADELSRILTSFEAEDISDIQPKDVNEEDVPPDPAIFDVLNFVLRDLEDSGEVHCPCKGGKYELRFSDEGAQVYCTECGATYTFHAKSPAVAEGYLSLDSITLS